MSEKKVRWGIVSTADIGLQKVVPAIMKSTHSEVTAIASRDFDKARAAADRLGIAGAYGSYDELFADPEIDAVYIPLPNHMHVDMTIAATQAGKHVLCEKPIGLNARDAERLKLCPKDMIVGEAFMVRYHRQWMRARDIVQSGELGEVRVIRSAFSYFNADPHNIRNNSEIGGGGIMDIGCYPIVAGRYFFDAEPRRVVSLIDRDPTFMTDRLASVIADFGNGRQLSFVVSTQAVPNQSVEIIGTRARLEIIIPFNAPQGEPTAILVDDGAALDGSLARREILPASDQYTDQAEAFAQAVLGQRHLYYGIDDAILNMKVIDAVFESEKTEAWADV